MCLAVVVADEAGAAACRRTVPLAFRAAPRVVFALRPLGSNPSQVVAQPYIAAAELDQLLAIGVGIGARGAGELSEVAAVVEPAQAACEA